MLWGKKILEWTQNAATAYEYMTILNDKWALDGRDPNSYSGIGWVMGKFDREFGEREIYGTVRYMASEQSKKRYETRKYLTTYDRRNNGTLLGQYLGLDHENVSKEPSHTRNVFASNKRTP